MFYNLTNRDGATTLSIVGGVLNEVIPDTHPNFSRICEHLLSGGSDEEYVSRLVNPAESISASLKEVTDRLTYQHNNLFFDGSPLHNTLGRHILRMIEEGSTDYARFVRFLINLDDNPSFRCQQAVYSWIEKNGLTVTEDGNFIGYKGVRRDGLSVSSGPRNYVNGVLYNEGADSRVPHEIGSVVSKKRADVDDNSRLACSVGLHVGTQSYASGFGERLLTVEINPADVVSVPDSDLEYKIRVCSYKVVALADPAQYEHTSWDAEDTGEWDAEEEVGADEPKTIAVSFDGSPVSTRLVVPDTSNPTLADWAELNPELMDDLRDSSLGHKALARKWAEVTSEASVRRWRKSNGVTLSVTTKIKDAVSH